MAEIAFSESPETQAALQAHCPSPVRTSKLSVVIRSTASITMTTRAQPNSGSDFCNLAAPTSNFIDLVTCMNE